MLHSISPCLPSTLLDPRRPAAANNGAPVITSASTFRLALPQTVERKHSAVRLLSEVEGQLSHAVVAPATAVQQRPAAPPRGRGGPSKPLSTSPHPPSALFDPRRPTAANDGDAVGASATAVRRRLSAPTTALPRPRGAPGSLSTSPHPPSAVFDPRRPTAANDSHAVQRWPRHKSAKASGGLSPPPCTLPRPSSTRAGPRRRTTAAWCNDAARQVCQGPGDLSPSPRTSLGPFQPAQAHSDERWPRDATTAPPQVCQGPGQPLH
ncbi:hypothetical protein SCP_0100050 [Sparassis crispa]|uniref:Uncharacterized protein n=1 Tax=Sparassis crispa TaxID=139825 RepID=A0A401G4P1_9APHY|nr:hypothetical protein SCP_0100050 [Sparassis crispa]GBE77133.1 hypothetical protein SCP_0100050 [Sparassis crispa]